MKSTPKNSPSNTPPPSPSRRSNQLKKKEDEDNFEFPPLKNGEENGQLAPPHTENHNSAEVIEDQQKRELTHSPPIMMKITKTYREQGNCNQTGRALLNRNSQYSSYLLLRSMENLKIFDLKTLAHLNITVDGYNGKGITQCFSCNNFHHSAENCFLKPRCLKCGEEHLTKDCPIKQRLETKYCINCQVYGHMANWYGCPCFPKPKKGAAKINRNSYTNLYNSFVRPNFSYAQVAKNSDNTKTNSNSQNKPQMAPRRPETSNQTEASINVPPLLKQVQNSNQAFEDFWLHLT
ncbi:nucleic-acid-binding protein from transposon X-element [Trichonephila clavipes]|nr:nucleic-acid-binding protein from transposon X-element [Trichonephila clavipes]